MIRDGGGEKEELSMERCSIEDRPTVIDGSMTNLNILSSFFGFLVPRMQIINYSTKY